MKSTSVQTGATNFVPYIYLEHVRVTGKSVFWDSSTRLCLITWRHYRPNRWWVILYESWRWVIWSTQISRAFPYITTLNTFSVVVYEIALFKILLWKHFSIFQWFVWLEISALIWPVIMTSSWRHLIDIILLVYLYLNTCACCTCEAVGMDIEQND